MAHGREFMSEAIVAGSAERPFGFSGALEAVPRTANTMLSFSGTEYDSQQKILLQVARHFAHLGANEIAFLAELGSRSEMLKAGAELIGADGGGNRALLLVRGWACRMRNLADGRSQVVELFLAGDLVAPAQSPRIDEIAPTVALSDVGVADATKFLEAALEGYARHDGLREVYREYGRRSERFRVNHITRLGIQTALERTAHLLLEFDERLTVAGLSQNHAFRMPLSQIVLAQILGLSVVHINRVLQHMRRQNLIALRGGSVQLLQPDHLRKIADYHGA